MDDLIVSYLLLSGECPLPGIGKISITRGNAVCDLASKELLPPEDNLHFDESTSGDITALTNYISVNTGCSEQEASEQFRAWISNFKERLNRHREVSLPFLGKLEKDTSGSISFKSKSSLNIFKAVRAVRVIHETATHDVIVGDKVSSSAEMQELLTNTSAAVEDKFWVPAVIIFSIAILIIVLYFILNTSGGAQSLHDTPASYLLK